MPKQNNIIMENFIFEAHKLSDCLAELNASSINKILSKIKEKCSTRDPSIAACAIHVLVKLVEQNILKVSQGLSTLISLISSSKENVTLLVPAVGRLLLLEESGGREKIFYNINDRPHPLLTILKNDWNIWLDVSAFIIDFICYNEMVIVKKIEVVWPILSYVLLDPQAPILAKSQVVNLLLISKQEKELFHLLSCQLIDENWCLLVREIHTKYLELDQLGSSTGVECITPCLAASAVYLIKHGHDPTCWLSLLSKSLLHTSTSDDIILFIFAKTIMSCPTLYLTQLCEICKLIIEKNKCSVFSAAAVAASLLCWSIAPNILSFSTLTYCQGFITHLSSLTLENSNNTTILMRNTFYLQIFNCNPELRWATNITLLIHQWSDEDNLTKSLRFLDERKITPIVDLHPLILGVGLQAKSIVVTRLVLKILGKKCNSDKTFAFSTLCLILHKLSHESDPQLQLEYLKLVPSMAIDSENVPLVLATILSIHGGASNVLLPLRLNLLVSLWILQPRVFSHLHTLLQTSSPKINDNWKLQVARANTLLTICRHNPHTNVKELVGLLSNVLNASRGPEESASASITLDAITELCRCKLIDAQGTWAALKAKMMKENRPLVGGSLCRLLAETAGDSGCEESIKMLWRLVESDCAASSALLALGRFPPQQFSLEILPARFKQGLKIPKELQYADQGQTIEQLLSYVPGEFWVQVLERIDSKILNSCEIMIQDFLKKEVADIPRGLYHMPLGAQEPSSYDNLPPTSILRAIVSILRKYVSDNSKERLKISIINILSKDYLRSFPPQDWTFLRPLFADENLKMSAMRLCALQGPKSSSAKQLLQEFLDLIKINDINAAAAVLKELPSIAQCVIASAVTTLVTDGLQALLVDNNLFNDAINNIRKTIALAVVPERNRKAAAKGVIALLLTDVLPDIEGLDILWECLAELPDNLVDPIVNLERCQEMKGVRLQQALRVSRACALSKSAPPCPLDCFVHLIDTVCSRPSDQSAVLDEILIVLNGSSISVGKCSVWFRQLITRLLTAISSSMPFEGCMFLLKILMVTSAALSGLDTLLVHDQKNEHTLLHIFPASISALFELPDWDPHISHIIEGLHRVSKWGELPCQHRHVVKQALNTLRSHPYCFQSSRWCRLYFEPLMTGNSTTCNV